MSDRSGALNRPGAELAKRPLHFIWILDCSSSMLESGKIQALNTAISEALPHMKEVAEQNPNAKLMVRALKFSSGATWHVSQPTPVEDFTWQPLDANGLTEMGRALKEVAEVLKVPPMEQRALPPVLVLVTDGYPTDDFRAGLNTLMSLPWGVKAVRLAIAMGKDANLDVLRQFIGHREIEPLQANNPDKLVKFIRWASTVAVQAASAPPSQVEGNYSQVNVPLTDPSDDDEPPTVAVVDVW